MLRRRVASVALLLGVLLAGITVAAQSSRPLVLADYYRIVTVRTPAMSPDGRWVAFIKSTIVESENRTQNELWLVATDGSAPARRLSDPALNAANPRWNSTGKLLAFSGRRHDTPASNDEGDSIWFLRMDQPNAPAFHVSGVGGLPLFSPDQKWIAFTRRASKPQAPKTTPDQDPVIESRFKGHIFDWLNYRIDGRGFTLDPRDPKLSPAEELFVVPSEGGEPRQLTHLKVNVQAAAWRPDSGALAFIANTHERDEYLYERADLFVAGLDGETKRLTDDGYNYDSPTWSPDGRAIAFRGVQGLSAVIAAGQNHGAPVDIYTIPADGGEKRNVTADWDLLPGPPTWSSDGRSLYISGGAGGNDHLFRVALSVSKVEQVTQGERRLSGFSPSARFTNIAYVGTDSTHPTELFVSAIDGGPEKQLTAFNRELVEAVQPVAPDHIIFPSTDGTEIAGWVLKPRGYDAARSWPLILTIHGGPHGAFGNDFSFEHQLFAANGYLVVYTNPRGSTNYGEKFMWATWGGGWGNLDFDDIMSGVDYVQSQYSVDARRLGVTGYSYGGFMTNWIIGHTGRFAAAVVGAGISNWITDYGVSTMARTKESEFYGPPWDLRSHNILVKQSPIEYVANVHTPTLFLHGESDVGNPIEESEQMYSSLKRLHVPAKFVRYADTSHGGWTAWNTVHRYYEELDWFRRYLSNTEASAKP